MKVLITGGAGFIGSHLAELHLQRGDAVRVLDDLSTGRRENLTSSTDEAGLTFLLGSVTDEGAVAAAIEGVEIVYHLAAAVGVRLVIEHPVQTIETNVRGTEVILRAAQREKAKVVIASTSEVYGKLERVPFREDDDIVLGATSKSRWSYACSKAIDEFLALAYAREQGLRVVIARLFNTIGPRQTGRYGMVLPNFVRQALAGENITVFGDGSQRRCFTHVSDVVHALAELAADASITVGVFNVGTDEEVTILELAQRVKKAAGSSSSIALVPYDEAYEPGFEDMSRRVPDLVRIRQTIAYQPRVTLDQAIQSVIEYQCARRKVETARPG